MKKRIPKHIERYRIQLPGYQRGDDQNGAFQIPFRGRKLKVIVSSDEGWDHVSVSLPNRTPTWAEMCYIKDIFFDPNETVVQFHPTHEAYINHHPNCLHLWKKIDQDFELPPWWMIGTLSDRKRK